MSATGARRACCRGFDPDKKLVWTYFEAMNPDRMPMSLLVVGSRRHRHRVRLVLPAHGGRGDGGGGAAADPAVEDAEIATFARKAFQKQGIKILTGAKVTKLDKKVDSVTATIRRRQGKTKRITVDRVISGGGRGRQYRRLRPREVRGEDRPQHHRDRGYGKTNVPASTPSATSASAADARPQGRARGASSASGDQGPPPATRWTRR